MAGTGRQGMERVQIKYLIHKQTRSGGLSHTSDRDRTEYTFSHAFAENAAKCQTFAFKSSKKKQKKNKKAKNEEDDLNNVSVKR